ncbi:MAG: DUF2207 family protein [Chloroflexota bacterium]
MAIFRVVLFALAMLGSAIAQPTLAQSDDRSVIWERFDVDLTLLTGGDFQIVETQRIYFSGTYRRGFREIPLARVTSISDVSVEENGQVYAPNSTRDRGFTVTRTGDVLRIDWTFPPVTNAARTFVIRYRANGALRVYDGGDQIWWQALYADRPGPVREGAVTVHLPSDVSSDQVRLGASPSSALREARLPDARTALLATQGLPAGTGFEIRVQIPHGLVAASPPSWQEGVDRENRYKEIIGGPVASIVSILLAVAILVLGGLWLLLSWFLRGRDPRIGRSQGLLTAPPSDLPPGFVGTLVDERADVQDVLATLVDLANRDLLRLSQVPADVPQSQVKDYRIRPLVERPTGLKAYEQSVFSALSRGPEGALLSVIKQSFVAQIPLIRDQLHAEVARAGLFVADPERVRRRYRLLGIGLLIIGAAGFAIGLAMFETVEQLVWLPFATLIPVGIGAIIMASFMPSRTRRGAIEAAQWRAFGRGLAASDDQSKGVPTKQDETSTLERYLPYAIALGVDTDWANRFDRVGTPAPHWFDRHDMPIFIGTPGGFGGTWGQGPARSGSDSLGRPASPAGAEEGLSTPDPQSASDSAAGGIQSTSDFLVHVLNAASEALSSGGDSDWGGGSGGGWSGGGSSGGGGGGGSGGFS